MGVNCQRSAMKEPLVRARSGKKSVCSTRCLLADGLNTPLRLNERLSSTSCVDKQHMRLKG